MGAVTTPTFCEEIYEKLCIAQEAAEISVSEYYSVFTNQNHTPEELASAKQEYSQYAKQIREIGKIFVNFIAPDECKKWDKFKAEKTDDILQIFYGKGDALCKRHAHFVVMLAYGDWVSYRRKYKQSHGKCRHFDPPSILVLNAGSL